MIRASIKVACRSCIKKIIKLGEKYPDLAIRVNGLGLEVRAFKKISQSFLDQLPKKAVVSEIHDGKKSRVSFKKSAFIGLSICTVMMMLYESVMSVSLVYATPFYLVALFLMVVPHFTWKDFKRVESTLFLLGVGIAITPLPFTKLILFVPYVSGFVYHLLLSSKKEASSKLSLFKVVVYQSVTTIAALTLHPSIWLLTVAPMAYAAVHVKNDQLNCDWSLQVVSLIVLVATSVSYFFALPAMICIHEAFIAIWLLNAKGMHLQSKGVENVCLQHYIAGRVLNEIVYVRAASKDVTISLSKCDLAICKAQYLKPGIEINHEARYSLDQFRDHCLPKDALLVSGEAIVESQSNPEFSKNVSSKLTQLDLASNKLVPLALMFASAAFAASMFAGMQIITAVSLAISTLLACCPCVFLMIKVFERSFEWLLKDQSVAGKVDFHLRCLEGRKWPSFKEWGHVFDRTGVTHGPVVGHESDKNAAWEMYLDAKDWLSCLSVDKKVHGLSAASEYADQYRQSMEAVGVPVNVAASYQNAQSKLQGFNQIVSDFNNTYNVMYEDGANGEAILDRANVLGIAMRQPSGGIRERSTCWLPNMHKIDRVIPAVIEGQKFASKLLSQCIHINFIAMCVPIVSRVVIGVILPMWAPCVLMMSSMFVMKLQIDRKVNTIKATCFNQNQKDFYANVFFRTKGVIGLGVNKHEA